MVVVKEGVSGEGGERTHLFTFCPPAPDEREKETSQMLRGTVSALRLASHVRAAASSSSLWSGEPRFTANARHWRVGGGLATCTHGESSAPGPLTGRRRGAACQNIGRCKLRGPPSMRKV